MDARSGWAAAAMAVVLAGCTTTHDVTATSTTARPPGTTAQVATTAPRPATGFGRSAVGLVRFDSCDALLDHLRAEATERVTAWGLGGWYGPDVLFDVAERALPSAADTAGAPAPSGTSSTNTQEAGVDEGDLVETDGRRVYSVVGGSLRIVDTVEPRVVATVPLPSGDHQLLLAGDRLAVVTRSWQAVRPWPAPLPEPTPDPTVGADQRILPAGGTETIVSLYDVTDPSAPELVGRTHLEGDLVAARAVSGVARLVLRSSFDRLPFVYPADAQREDEAKAANERAIATSTIEQWLPRAYTEAADGTTGPVGVALPCDRVDRPRDFSGLGMAWLVTLDLAGDGTVQGSAGVVSHGETVYASTSTLYLATVAWPELEGGVAPVRPEPLVTAIHAFDLDAPGGAAYVASGAVTGTLLNQFSLSEHEGVLRVAVTSSEAGFGTTSESSVHTFGRDGDRLVELGVVGGLGRTEQIYAVRFLGPLGYVVTFRQTDPLYVLDLRDPAAPRLAGELKIPGYSSYLHPIDDGHLVGIGQDATDEGRVLGTQLSLFDVRDPSAPARLASVRIGDSSAAEYDHHAFLWWPETGSVVVPTSTWREGAGEGVAVVDLVGDALTERGWLGHPPSGDGANAIQRSLVVDGRLVTVSPAGVMVSDLGSLQQVAWVPSA